MCLLRGFIAWLVINGVETVHGSLPARAGRLPMPSDVVLTGWPILKQ